MCDISTKMLRPQQGSTVVQHYSVAEVKEDAIYLYSILCAYFAFNL